ncbi:hypothetical protein BSLG_005942 [Batrachochytrium salamandrivorans]|nr:hypothetical protein BSLG_005942 [Batrachochytrium salamandrivorans]
MGRKAFDRHFQEWRHAHGIRCLGIPNSKQFHDVTSINDAYALAEKLKSIVKRATISADAAEEFEDDGNVYKRRRMKVSKSYLGLFADFEIMS